LEPQKLDILSLGRYLFIYSVVSVNRNIVRYNKYLVLVTIVVVFVSYCYSYCDFILQSLLVCSSLSTLFILFLEKSLIVLSLDHYKYWSEYLLCGRLQWERTAVESLNFLTLWLQLTIRGQQFVIESGFELYLVPHNHSRAVCSLSCNYIVSPQKCHYFVLL